MVSLARSRSFSVWPLLVATVLASSCASSGANPSGKVEGEKAETPAELTAPAEAPAPVEAADPAPSEPPAEVVEEAAAPAKPETPAPAKAPARRAAKAPKSQSAALSAPAPAPTREPAAAPASAPAPAPAMKTAAVPSAYAGPDPCKLAVKGNSPVVAACSKGGLKEAKKVMKAMVKQAKAAGEKMDCDTCHPGDDYGEVSEDGRKQFKRLLELSR